LDFIEEHFRSLTQHGKEIVCLINIEGARPTLQRVSGRNYTAMSIKIALPLPEAAG